MFINDSLVGNVISFVVTVLVLAIVYCKWVYQYWNRRGVPNLEPNIPFGNIKNAIRGKEHVSISLKRIYDVMKKDGQKYGGIYLFTKPSFFPIDLDIVRNILTKDFQYFADRDTFYNEKDPLQAHLLNLTGTKWKNLRAKLTPTFTSGKMKMMFNIMEECQHDLQKRMEIESRKNEPIDIKEILACYTTNVIGSCAFGLDCKALENEDSEFRTYGKKMFTAPKWLRWKRSFAVTFPKIAKYLNLRFARLDIVNFFMNIVEKTIEYREKNNYSRNDFMQMMINLKNKEEDPLTMDEVASQCIVFFAAGFETSSTLMTFALYELAKNQGEQDKLRKEINKVLVKYDNQLTYDSIQEIEFLNQVIDETLRIHPPASITNRRCIKDYKLPDGTIIEKGTNVTVPILGIHYDEEYYPDAKKFDPGRFSEENKKNRHNYSHLPFGEGPRNCIGMRFGLLQAKVGLVALIRNYKFTVNQKTREPLFYDPASIILTAKGEIWLNAEKI